MIRFICTLLALATAACVSPALPVTGIPIAKDATFDLLPPSALGQSISLEQIVDAKYGDKEFSFHCLLEVDAKQLTLVGMTPMNTRAFTLTFDGEKLSVEMMPGAQLPAPPERILADLQLALWPKPIVHGLEVDEVDPPPRGSYPEGMSLLTPGDDFGASLSKTRCFRQDGRRVIYVLYFAGRLEERWSGRVAFTHLEQGYELRIKTLRAEKLEP